MKQKRGETRKVAFIPSEQSPYTLGRGGCGGSEAGHVYLVEQLVTLI